jgi:serine/threonine-protein kinase
VVVVVICPACGTDNIEASDTCFKCGKGLYALTLGSVLADRYEILDALGKGGMGMVYKAHDRVLDEVVALKVLRADFAGSPDLERRLRSEIKLARRVRQRNVCGIHEYGQHGPISFIVMELIEGVDLRKILREQGALPPEEAFEVSIQLAQGLQAIHDAGVVHRDLKTPNIMRDANGVVRLMDFGIAKEYTAETSATATGQILGTPEYMSPEQAQGERIDGRSDIYALGIVIFELFTGRVPFQGETPLATIFKHLRDVPPLEAPDPPLPAALKPVLRKALGKTPAERYASASELGAALQIARERPLEDAPPAELVPTTALPVVLERPGPAVTKAGRAPWAAAALGLVVLAGLVAGLWPGASRRVPGAAPSGPPGLEGEAPGSDPAQALAVPAAAAAVTSATRDPQEQPTGTPAGASVPGKNPVPPPTTVLPVSAPPEPTVAKAPQSGLLQLLIIPWAEVMVDGKSVGTTPFKPLSLPLGEHTIVLNHPSYKPVRKRVMIRPGVTTKLEVDLGFEAFPR